MAKRGRPTTYKPEYCQQIINFFSTPQLTEDKEITWTTKSGTVKREIVKVANRLPTMEKFAIDIGTYPQTLLDWCKRFSEFNEAYSRAKAYYKEFLNQNALSGRYNERYATFLAINTTDMRQTQTVDISQSGPIVLKIKEYGTGKIPKK